MIHKHSQALQAVGSDLLNMSKKSASTTSSEETNKKFIKKLMKK